MRPTLLIATVSVLLCTMLVAGTTLSAKALGNGGLGGVSHPLMVSQARFVFGFAGVVVVLALRKGTGMQVWAPGFGKPRWGLQALRTGLGWASGAMMFTAASRMPLADASALSFTSPVATMTFAALILGEKVGPWRWGAGALALFGALILLRPGAGVIQPAALFALGAALLMGLEAIAIKRLATTEPPGRTMLINNAMGALIASLIAIPVWEMPATPAQWGVLVAMGLVMVTAQILLLTANRLADASYVAPFFYTTLIWAAAYDAALFDVWPDAVSITGAAVIICAGLLMTWREVRARRLRQTGQGARASA
ncbi:MAG: DMT family transporter [Paracoccaceae bacterium]